MLCPYGRRAGRNVSRVRRSREVLCLPSKQWGRTESRVFSPKNNNQTLFLLLRFSLSVVLRSSSLGSHTKTVCLSLRYVPPSPFVSSSLRFSYSALSAVLPHRRVGCLRCFNPVSTMLLSTLIYISVAVNVPLAVRIVTLLPLNNLNQM